MTPEDLSEPGKTAHETMMDDVMALGRFLHGTAIPNHRLVVALMNAAFSISSRDELSREAYVGTLGTHLRIEAGRDGQGPFA
jgi:hypothetical protein